MLLYHFSDFIKWYLSYFQTSKRFARFINISRNWAAASTYRSVICCKLYFSWAYIHIFQLSCMFADNWHNDKFGIIVLWIISKFRKTPVIRPWPCIHSIQGRSFIKLPLPPFFHLKEKLRQFDFSKHQMASYQIQGYGLIIGVLR